MKTGVNMEEFVLTVNILEITKTMYSTPKVSLLHEGENSQSFSTKIGLKQGDVLSTLLFCLYINQVVIIFCQLESARDHVTSNSVVLTL